jgi:hypothetical protein
MFHTLIINCQDALFAGDSFDDVPEPNQFRHSLFSDLQTSDGPRGLGIEEVACSYLIDFSSEFSKTLPPPSGDEC